ncbi:hypothetical protein RDJLphi1_gp40 [Roseobacter phage RDJL Phi 1]|uniref:Uncharacterized protein n=1 Tax=Roseobacter phage RDJL Phi 1 TaxID=562742 RepID=F4YXQ1_9CAUD|nr:hypothetical protein RDJLphi1_gp40 [Roseobacter phage RDJL Phi 1]ADK73441.1 hypothetical protein RDJLphi1_gp40 [Roseobacter phage RDJL Phi 1]
MAEVKTISTSIKCRVNTAQYEGTEASVYLMAELEDFDDPEEEQDKLFVLAEKAMLNNLRAIYKGRGKNTSAKMIAKQHGITFHG